MPAYSDLHPYKEDTEIWVKDPIKTAFDLRLHTFTTTASGAPSHGKLAWDWTLLKILPTHEYWVEFASDWLSFCIGGEVTAKMPDEALSLSWDVILEVLYLRFSHTQMQNFRAYVCSSLGPVDVPADFCWMDDLQQRDASDSDSDSDYMEGIKVTYVDEDEEMLDHEGSQSNSDSGDDYVPDFIQSQSIGLPTKDRSLPLPVSLNPAGLLESWCQHMCVFFYPKVRPDQKYRQSKQDVVVDLTQMRKLPAKVWKTKEFQTALEVLHLTHPLLICRWTKAIITEEERELRPKPDPNYKFTAEDVLALFVFISQNPLMRPWVFDPMSVFFLLSRDSFVYNFELWLAPALRTLDYPRMGSCEGLPDHHATQSASGCAVTIFTSFLAALDMKLTLVISETSDHRALRHEVRQQAWRPNFPGTVGFTQPPVDQHPSTKGQKRNASKRNKKENARKVEAQLLGSALEPEEREYNFPNCWNLPADDQYVNPEEINLRWVKPRPETQERCGLDITHSFFVPDTGNKESLGGVQYNAMEPKLLEHLIDNHRRVKVHARTCQAQGGAKGDVYGPYACHTRDTADDIKALFHHATDADVMVEIRSTIVSGLHSDMIAVTNAAEVGHLGRHGLTNYYCSNYISAVHRDFDVGKHNLKQKEKGKKKQEDVSGCHPCVQLEQTGTNKILHEWDFAMVRWGIVIETHSNTVWCFNGRHEHGSVIPSRSSHEANAASSGYHPTKSKRDVDRAKVFQQIRLGMELRPRV
ncbi:hypothetical protein B0H17DRAFT_1126651 [Mycena rosella]|uniref:Uncharacterized protein n=1 Tax=Mycena rosella TaxID=1033263 RepID=A0AAD7GTM7_MYCRO|nr:hypothetical protein B0H17DRAFT_1126651 [Mycena rosella]